MEWKKFKREMPTDPYNWVTDWYTVWPSYEIFGNWVAFTKANPEYGWAKMECPETPVEPKEKRECYSGKLCLYRRFEDQDGLWLAWSDKDRIKIEYCPFCGYKP